MQMWKELESEGYSKRTREILTNYMSPKHWHGETHGSFGGSLRNDSSLATTKRKFMASPVKLL